MKKFETLAIHAGQGPDAGTGAVMPPIHLSTTFAEVEVEVEKPAETDKGGTSYDYSRTNNPTRQALEECLAALEGAQHAAAYASGCAAMAAAMMTLRSGDHVVAGNDLYGGSLRLLQRVMQPLGIGSTLVDLRDERALLDAFRPETKIVWMETPTNPLLRVVDIRAIARVCRGKGVTLIVDNTFATPWNQRPLHLGADVVMHSTTKYLNGHSDVVGGALITSSDSFMKKVRFIQNSVGAVPSPFDCFLVLRGLKTLPVRMRQHAENASGIAQFLEQQPEVERVLYPGLPSHSECELASEQMKTPGGMVSFELKRPSLAMRFVKSLRIFTCAESLGGVESLAEVPAVMTHASLSAEARQEAGVSAGLVRISVGLEALDDLCEDLRQAFDRIST